MQQQQDHATKKKQQKAPERTRDHLVYDMKSVLNDKVGRRVLWDIMAHCRVFESIWEPSARIHYLAGRQDVGHMILSLINDANPEAMILMMNENKGEK